MSKQEHEAVMLLTEWMEAIEHHPFVELASNYPDLAKLYIKTTNFVNNPKLQREIDSVTTNSPTTNSDG